MTDEQREREIRERVERATPGPWRLGWPVCVCALEHEHDGESCDYRITKWYDGFVDGHSPVYVDAPVGAPLTRAVEIADNAEGGPCTPDADFIAHAREDVPWLLARLDAVRHENARLRAELEDARWLIEDLQFDLRLLARRAEQLPQWKRDLVESRSRMLRTEPQTVRHVRDEMLKPREYDTAAEAIREAQERADRKGRAAFVWYDGYRTRWAVRDTEPTEADYAEGWTLAARMRPSGPVA